MLKLATQHSHPSSGMLVTGLRLRPGAVLDGKDLYASTSGTWEQNPCGDLELGNTEGIWVRPESEMSNDARNLLMRLTSRYPGPYTCVRRLGVEWFIVPGPSYEWICGGPCATYPVSGGFYVVLELVGYGFLKYGWDQITAELTKSGAEAGKKLLF